MVTCYRITLKINQYGIIHLYIVFIKSLIDFAFVFLSSKIDILDGNFMLFMIHKTNLIIKVILFSIFALCGNLQRVLMFSLISVCFFLVFLLSHSISKKMRQALIIFCEVHFSLLYILQLDLISKSLERSGSLTLVILSQLGRFLHELLVLMLFVLLGTN